MRLMSPTDSVFLLGESREHPMHVGGLLLFEPPPDAGPDYARMVYEDALAQTESTRLFRTHPANPVGLLGTVAWTTDKELDLDYHIRHNALPKPGRVRELLALVSRMHGSLLDRHRPLWELHVIEGLEDGRIALYTKVHHALVDGVSSMRLLQRSLSEDPDKRDCPLMWSPSGRHRRNDVSVDPVELLRSGAAILRDAAGLAPVTARIVNKALNDKDLVRPLQAPHTMFNVGIGGARRFAAQSWPIDRCRSVARSTGTKLNDVVLAMCAGALREYLLERNALPEDPLIAAVPVSLHSRRNSNDDGDGGGNAVSVLLCNLATDVADPLDRLAAINNSMNQGKDMMAGLTQLQATAVGAASIASLTLAQLPGLAEHAPASFNLFISNVPGPKEEMYYNGARLDGFYPVSIVLDGFALNITLTSRAGYLDFGLIGCRHSVPHLQRLLTHLDDSLTELEKAAS
ncbi:wax ester/triacylglycerol synthase family O-acyltransferase [Skermania sp. ID1734]|uniref:WS/DGAT/MGAT family O-acyltransferase n=1 Tax=Skermania sp. ID1734 TaxID=2597516 RepID=UPI00117F5388|nr:wax ester/triacylglycerol synthase family O-acyltransferase [Skermania sp. ID1734]TSE00293.1 wax ester/triacylglycerol synthase family O-acyltransferase [Skermania sp. ID1734]